MEIERLPDPRVAGGDDVRLLVDSFGANADARFFASLTDAGGKFLCFQPRWTRRYLIRNHQKIVVADRRIAMLGGFNVEDTYFAASMLMVLSVLAALGTLLSDLLLLWLDPRIRLGGGSR